MRRRRYYGKPSPSKKQVQAHYDFYALVDDAVQQESVNMKILDADVLQEDAFAWSEKTFGKDRGPEGPLNHLKRECDEAIANPTDIMEFGDMWLLLSDAASRAGFTMSQVLFAAQVKLDINKNRKWGDIDSEGVSEHIKEA